MMNLNVLDRLGLRRLLTGNDGDFDVDPQRRWVEDPWAQLWFAVFPTAETLGAQLLAAALVVGSYFLAREQSVRSLDTTAA